MWHFEFGIFKLSLHFRLLLILSRSYWDVCQFPKYFDMISSYSDHELPLLLIFHGDNSQKFLEAWWWLGQSHRDSRGAGTAQVCWLSAWLLPWGHSALAQFHGSLKESDHNCLLPQSLSKVHGRDNSLPSCYSVSLDQGLVTCWLPGLLLLVYECPLILCFDTFKEL